MDSARDSASTSTIPPDDSGTNGWEVRLRMLSIVLIVGLVLCGLGGLLGVRETTAVASGNGYILTVKHASVTRPGLATPFGVQVARADGSSLPTEITLRIDAAYLEMFDENGIEPDPTSSFHTSRWTWWTFALPSGSSEFQVSFDARLEPAVQWGVPGSASLEMDGLDRATAQFHTWVMP